MNRYCCLLILLGIVLSTAPAHAHHLAVVASKDNHVESITSAELARLVKAETRKWADGNEVVVVVTRSSAISLQVLERLCHMSERELKAFMTAHHASFIFADSDAELLSIVENNHGSLGLVDVHSIQGNQVRVLKVDGRLPMEQGYLPH